MVTHTNKPRISWYIAFFYFFIAVMLFVLWIQIDLIVIKIVLFLLLVTLIYHIIWIFNTKYVINDGILEIHSLYGTKRIRKIKETRKIEVPNFLRFIGSSFYTGYYYHKYLGKCFLAITNFDDAILVKSDNNYIVTPKNPESFMKLLKK